MGRRVPYCTHASRTPWKVSSSETLRLAPCLVATRTRASIVRVWSMRYGVRALVLLSGRALLPAGRSVAAQAQVFLCSQHVVFVDNDFFSSGAATLSVLVWVTLGCFLFFREQILDGDGEEPPAVHPEAPPAPGEDISPPSRKPAGVWAADHSRLAAGIRRCE